MKTNGDESNAFSKIVVVGLGYIGLPTAAILAAKKIKVVGVDVNPEVVDSINRGEVHFKEPELDILVHSVVTEGYLFASTKPESADAFLIAVPTPFKENHQPDLSYVKAASESIAPFLKRGDLVILESTSPVGTTEEMAGWLATARPDLTFPLTGEDPSVRIAYCPERVMPGHLIHELVHNDRIVGGMTPECSVRAQQLYKTFVDGECFITNSRTAEMCKLTENSFRDVNIAFANELSIICDKLEIDVWELIKLANRHPRVSVLKPGAGVGGHCIAVDPWFVISSVPEEAKLIKTARLVNDSKPFWVIEKVRQTVAEFLKTNPSKTEKDVTIACFGLTFKANSDDLRESPALRIADEVANKHSGHVVVVEPHIDILPDQIVGKVELNTIEEALVESDIFLMLVGHRLFMNVLEKMSKRHVIDVCGIWK